MPIRKQLIVGIDPGTTTAYFLIDIKTLDIIAYGSKKEFSLSSLIKKIIDYGKPLIVSCDKKKIPEFVKRFGIKTGARLIWPNSDLTTNEKRDLFKTFLKNKISTKDLNSHEFDASVSAGFGIKVIYPLLRKIIKFVNENKCEDKFYEIAELVIKQEISIRIAFERIIKNEKIELKKEKPVKIHVKKIDNKFDIKIDNKQILNLKEIIKDLNLNIRKKNDIITKQKQEIKNITGKLKLLDRIFKKSLIKEKARDGLMFKDYNIKFLKSEINALKNKVYSYEKSIDRFKKIFLSERFKDYIVLKKLNNLGKKEFQEKNKILKIKKEDVLFVDDSNIINKSVIKELKGVVEYIITSQKRIKKIPNFIIINKKINMIDFGDFFIVQKNDFEKAKKSMVDIEDIVKDYKKQRKN